MKKTKEEFIEESRKIHGSKYDYSNVEYVNNSTKVCIICPEHGEFWQTPSHHLNGNGCPKCGLEKVKSTKKYTINDFVKKARKIHGNKYDYSKVKYINATTKVCIICPNHGEFWQTPAGHLSGRGCRECRKEHLHDMFISNTEEFIKKAKKIHKNEYIYDNVNYIDKKTPVHITCKKHGNFLQTPDDHLHGCGCPVCGNQKSLAEKEIYDYVKNVLEYKDAQERTRKVLDNYELDIYIPSKKIGIEYNGIIWHSEKFGKGKDYHLKKLNKCNEKGIKLIQVFEDEWLEHKKIVLSKISHVLEKDNHSKIYGRKCFISLISNKNAKFFLEENHIQGFYPSTVYLGSYADNILIGVMSFKLTNENEWELTRFATDINYRCVGVASKMFSFFLKKFKPYLIKTFADRRWTTNSYDNLYIRLGFKLDKILSPDYSYVKDRRRIHKFNCRKQRLIRNYPDSGLKYDMTEKQMCDKLHLFRIWDCGKYRYVWFNKN